MQALAYDVETTAPHGVSALEPHRGARMFAFSTRDEDGRTLVLRKDREPYEYHKELKRIWRATDVRKVMHNAKFDLTFTRVSGVKPPWRTPIHDTMIMSKILWSDAPSHKLKDLTANLCNFPRDDEVEVKRAIAGLDDYARCPPHIMDVYQARDVERTMLLYYFFWPKIKSNPKLLTLYKMELALLWVTMQMEERGMRIAPIAIDRLKKRLTAEVGDIEQRFPKGVNPDKKEALAKWLFEDLGLPVQARTLKKQAPSTGKESLLALLDLNPRQQEVLDVMKWRSYSGGATTLESYLEFADEKSIIRPNINTYGAHTGRQSCDHPNLHNVSKEFKPDNPFPVPARSVFYPRKGYLNFLVDYAGIEMRLIAEASGDEAMIALFREGGDPHSEAAKIFYQDLFTKENSPKRKKGIRDQTKNAHFALAYGAGLKKLAAILLMSPTILKPRLEEYRARFPEVISLARRMAKIAKEQGYVETTFGRRIRVNPSKTYPAVNFRIQGTGADILKYAEVRVGHFLEEAREKYGLDWHLLLPIHDELIIEAPRSCLRTRSAQPMLHGIRREMLDFPNFSVPLEIEIEVATGSWADAEKYELAG